MKKYKKKSKVEDRLSYNSDKGLNIISKGENVLKDNNKK